MTESASHVRVMEETSAYWRVLFDNPPFNIVDASIFEGLQDLLARMDSSPSLRVIVFESANPEFYLAHFDLTGNTGNITTAVGPSGLPILMDTFVRLTKPQVVSIAKIRGCVRGVSSEFALACDMRFASRENTLLGQPEVGVGINPGGGGTERLPLLVGRGRALEIVLGARDFDGDTAERYGYVNRALPDAELDGFVDAIGGTIINNFGWHATFFLVIPIAIALFVSIRRFIHIDMDKATARISDKNTEFCCRFIHVRRDILLSESSIPVEYGSSSESKSTVDIAGAITLSITIIAFLVALQFIQTVNASDYATVPIVIGFGAAAIISLSFFIMIERRAYSPLIDLKLLLNRILLPANIINMVVGITSLMVVYQTIPILIRSPPPLGFGGDALSIANVQLPYMVVSLIVSIASGFIVSKFGN
ncbi:MAG: enoyl-CoA hydratase-related protein [Candidatus Nitrosopolaris sp.]|jgi:enoyl-CoA hydratase/carnithine racemase